jgi:ribose transport system ATP-binding protein
MPATIRLAGHAQPVRFAHARAAQDHGIGMVHQELNLVPGLSVAENIWLGREPRTAAGLIDYRATARRHRCDSSPASISRCRPRTLVGDLRVGQQQLVEIAKALSARARILILDEPTSSLSAHEVGVLFAVIADLKRAGVGLVYITHKFEELARLCDDVVVLRDGRVVGGGRGDELTREQIVRLMAGRDTTEQFARTPVAPGDELLRVESLPSPAAAPAVRCSSTGSRLPCTAARCSDSSA